MEKKILEAALFIAGRPLDLDELAKIAGIHSLGYVKDLLHKLKKDYEGRGLDIVHSSRGWEMQIRSELLPKIAHLTPYSDVSEGSKRTLALVATREPLRQSDLVKMQGTKVYSYVKELENMGLIKVEKHGRSKVLSLSQEFERYFGEEKESIKKRLQEESGYQKQKIHDFVEKEPEMKEKTAEKTKKSSGKETRKPKKKSASSGEIPW